MTTILCFDPSGNTGDEGNGTTGYALYKDGKLITFGDIAAKNYQSTEEYFWEHENLIEALSPNVIVCESYRLFGNKAKAQSGSQLGTPQLIGYMMMEAWKRSINWVIQNPSDKARMNDAILEHMGVIEKKGNKWYCMDRVTNLHMRDAIRHGQFYLRFGVK